MKLSRFHLAKRLLLIAATSLILANQAVAYVDLAPTLAKIISDSKTIQLVEVAQYDQDKHVIILNPIQALKGELNHTPVQHDVAEANGNAVPHAIQQWAEPGARAVLFGSRASELLCFGDGWYGVRSAGNGGWKLGTDRSDLPLAYFGTVPRLANAITQMLAGRDVIITTVQHGADDAASFDVALNRVGIPGLVRVQRVRANMTMPGMVYSVSANPAYFIGRGRVGEEDLPALLAQLKDTDPSSRAEAADELRDLGNKAVSATASLSSLLNDLSAQVRFESAATLLCLDSRNEPALNTLAKGLSDVAPLVCRDAARAVGQCGPGAATLVDKLARLLSDTNESVRVSGLQAVALLGPVAAAATPAVVPLLDSQDTCIEAADALGRIGPGAQPVPKQLVAMLSSKETSVQQAALRSMAQIGGKEAHPAVEYIAARVKTAAEVEKYNMMIYLSLIGTNAADAIPIARNSGLIHPVIPSATVWALTETYFPWQSGSSGATFDTSAIGGLDITSTMYEAYFRELGSRLRPVAQAFVQKLVAGTAGTVPAWGYKLLTCAPEESVRQLSACLREPNLAARERAAVALGYMGQAASAAKTQVSTAIEKSTNEQERRLMEWCLRHIAP